MRPPARLRTVLCTLAVASLVALAGLVGGCGPSDGPSRVRLATTTSVRDSKLLEWVLPEAEKRADVKVSVIAVGSGQALEKARRGDADLVIVHDRELEDAFLKDGCGIDRHDLAWNDFVVVGPPDDPAGVKGQPDATKAFARLADAKASFVSRGDKSGTHSREKMLWANAGVNPAWDGYKESGQGMGPTLIMADEKRAYTLTDRSTFVSMRKRMHLAIAYEGGADLVNPYGLILVNPAKIPGVAAKPARAVMDYLMSPEGQARIGAYRVDGEAIFHPGAPPK